MDKNGIETIIESFKKVSERATEEGYKILEIHGAHGYLIKGIILRFQLIPTNVG